jgi:tRNA threonylcarbamoyladenosine biosynthesis protein TsaE
MATQFSLATSFFSASPEQTKVFAKEFAKKVSLGTVVCLEGDLGSGKTTFSKAFISAFAGVEEDAVQSPTFVYQNTYPCSLGDLHHFDLYRLQNEHDFIELGFLDYINPKTICLIEWPCRVFPLLTSYILITIQYVNAEERLINIQSIEDAACL